GGHYWLWGYNCDDDEAGRVLPRRQPCRHRVRAARRRGAPPCERDERMERGRGWRERPPRIGTAGREGRGGHRSRPGGLQPPGPKLPRDRDRTGYGRTPAGDAAAVPPP